jgi:predicted metal-binding membrane protein
LAWSSRNCFPVLAGLARRQARVAELMRWRPEWPFVLVIFAAWIVMLVDSSRSADHAGHHAHSMLASPNIVEDLTRWGVMSVAMMLPAALPAVGFVALNSLRGRQQRAMMLCAAGYIGVWVACGVPLLLVERLALEAAHIAHQTMVVVEFALAAGWQVTRFKRRALFQCLQTVPLPPVGLRADAASARFGMHQGWRCVQSCWALMFLVTVVGHSAILLLMIVTALILTEELTFVGRRLLGASGGALAVAAGISALGL